MTDTPKETARPSQMDVDVVQRLQALQAEYFRLENIIEKFDDRALTIKAWSVTLCTAGIGAAYVEAQPALLLVSAVAALLFWVIEALWKSNQQAFYSRAGVIETASQNDLLAELRPYNIAGAWHVSWQQQRDERAVSRRILWWPHVALPHVAVAGGGAVLFVVHSLWWKL